MSLEIPLDSSEVNHTNRLKTSSFDPMLEEANLKPYVVMHESPPEQVHRLANSSPVPNILASSDDSTEFPDAEYPGQETISPTPTEPLLHKFFRKHGMPYYSRHFDVFVTKKTYRIPRNFYGA